MPTISTTEAARILGVSPQRVRVLCKQRRIPGARLLGRDWRIPLKDGVVEVLDAKYGPPQSWKK